MPRSCDALVLGVILWFLSLCSQPYAVYFWLWGSIYWAKLSLCTVLLTPGLAAFLPGVTLCPAPLFLTL